MNIEHIIHQYDFNLLYAKELVRDLTEPEMTTIPASGLENHPAFTLGHLVSGSAMLAEDLGASFEMPESWKELFSRNGPGDPRKPDSDSGKYPGKLMLLEEFEQQHSKVKSLLFSLDKGKFSEPIKWRFSNFMPKVYNLVVFMCINHEAMHLGQLAAWRRAMGKESALGRI